MAGADRKLKVNPAWLWHDCTGCGARFKEQHYGAGSLVPVGVDEWDAEVAPLHEVALPRGRRSALVFVGVLGAGVAGVLVAASRACSLVPGSHEYRSNSPRESNVLPRASRTLFPRDIRANGPRTELVAWAGVVDGFNVTEEGDDAVIRIDASHRYFDWIEDHGVQRARYFLSPRGEGKFRASIAMPIASRAGLEKAVAPGDMIIAYGVPAEVRGEVIGLFPTEHVRPVPREMWRDDVLDYGRPGEPIKQLQKVIF